MTTQRCVMAGNVVVPGGKELEILAISAGNGNGWEFSDAVLRESLPLWQGADCFIDHSWSERSVRDLAGVCCDPVWDEAERGIRLKLKSAGPEAALLEQMAAETS